MHSMRGCPLAPLGRMRQATGEERSGNTLPPASDLDLEALDLVAPTQVGGKNPEFFTVLGHGTSGYLDFPFL